MKGEATPGKGAGLGLGFRVWKIRVNKVNKDRLKVLYNDVIRKRNGNMPKGLLYYAEEWDKMFENVKEMRRRAGKRTPLKTPPLPLLVKFIMPDGQTRGNKSAPAVIDLRKGELRIPSYGVRVPLRSSLVRALIEENELEPRPEFTLQVTRKGLLRLIAHRALRPPALGLPLRIVAIDENSLNGFTLAVWDVIKENRVALSMCRKMMPRNRGFIDAHAALLQSAADCNADKLKEARELLPLELTSPEKLAELARATKSKEKRLNKAFTEELVALVRQLVRTAMNRGWSVAIVVDPIDHKSIRGSRLQRTLLRTRRALRNLAYYEGVTFASYRASGKRCPLCGQGGIKFAPRKYRCHSCALEWDRDKNAVYQLAQKVLARYFREECSDDTYIDLAGWLREHPRALL